MIRGVIEGFYGRPWTHAERLDLIAFCGEEGFDTWVHAPKDDPYHRERWRDPYPADELARLAELAAAAGRAGIELTCAIAPGLSIQYDSERDLAQLLAKAEQLRSAGVRRLQLLWDDIESRDARGQAEVSNRFREALPQDVLVVCPVGYAGTEDTTYRRELREHLDPAIAVYWTGPEVVSFAIAREELDAAAARFGGRSLLVWDNYPVNDFTPELLFLGPLRGRDPRLWDGPALGLVANGMVQAVPSKLALATVADYLRDPHAYDPVGSFERALRLYGAEVRDALLPLAARGGPAEPRRPRDVDALIDALALGVDAASGRALLEGYV